MSDTPAGAPEPDAPARAPGTVYTFYSYKGGVGRSMALANVGVLLASQGRRVLLVDWDLEAPGLEVYFRTSATLHGDPAERPGIVDLLEAHAEQRDLVWRQCLLRATFAGAELDIITAGRRDDDYRRRVQQLDWEAMFREHRVGHFVDRLRTEWREAYDVVLVDSRTGITDIGDICTVLLPDVLVLLFVTNHQNVEGIRSVMRRAERVRAALPIQRGKLIGVPVPARDERDRESAKFDEWHRIFARELGPLFREWLPRDVRPEEALLRLFIPYIAAWSFGESLPVLESQRERTDPSSLGAAYSRLATLLAARLDWGALDAKADASELVSTRLDASAARDAAREAEAARAEAETRLAEAEREKAAAEQALQRAGLWTRWSSRWLLFVTALSVAAVAWFAYRSVWPSTLSPAAALEALASPSPATRQRGLKDLNVFGLTDPQKEQLRERIRPLLEDPSTRRQAWERINFFLEAPELVPLARAALSDAEYFVRFYAITFLRNQPGARQYASEISQMLEDPEGLVRWSAAKAMGTIGPPASADTLRRLQAMAASDADADNRKVAAEALAQIKR